MAAVASLFAGWELVLAVNYIAWPDRLTRFAGAATLLGAIAVLAADGVRNGWGVHCGCFAAFFDTSVGAAVLRNVIALGIASWLVCSTPREDAVRRAPMTGLNRLDDACGTG